MKKIIIIAVVALLLVAGVAVGLFMFVFNKKDGEEKKKEVAYQEFVLDDMYCNIMNTQKILKVKMAIQYTDVKLKEKLEKEFKAKITNDASEYLRSRSLEQLTSTNGQKRLREDILDQVRTTVESEEGVTDVFFTDYIIQ